MKAIPHFTIQKKEVVTFEEKVRYVKEHLHMTVSPVGGSYTVEQIDKMVYLIDNDWKESGHYHYEWIETVYSDMIEMNKKTNR